MKTVKVATIVVSYNPYKSGFFPLCLQELDKVQLKDAEFSLEHKAIVVDSASSDQTPVKVAVDFPQMEIIASEKNLGYAGGNNLGFKKALEWGAEYIAVVTQDVYVKPSWLLQAIKAAESDRKIGAVQPLILLWPKRDQINSTGNAIHFLGYGYARDYQLPLRSYTPDGLKEVPYPSGAIVLLRAEALREVGFFDEEMWMYNEDQDLGWRMWMHGYTNVLAPYSRAYHQYEFSRSISKMYYMDRNRLLVILQNYHFVTLLLILPALLLNEIAGIILAWRGGWLKEKIAVWNYFLKWSSWKELLRKRAMRQRTRTVPDKKILPFFTGKILFQDLSSPLIRLVANPILSLYFFILKLIVKW